MRQQILAWAIVLPVTVIGHPVLAAQAVEVSFTVGYEDLNLAHPKGRAALQRRVSHAVNRACGEAGRTLSERSTRQQCLTEARADATPQVERVLAQAGRSRHGPAVLAANP